jgi:hypothetical protein
MIETALLRVPRLLAYAAVPLVLVLLALPPAGTLAQAQSDARDPADVTAPPGAVVSADGLRAAWGSEDHRSILSATRTGATRPWSAPMRLLTTRGKVGKLVFS